MGAKSKGFSVERQPDDGDVLVVRIKAGGKNYLNYRHPDIRVKPNSRLVIGGPDISTVEVEGKRIALSQEELVT